jgi:hypothetical protein
MKDLNQVRLTGTIFWSKLDDRQTYSLLRLGIKLLNGSSCFVTVNNPSTKSYDIVKTGNKIVLTNGMLDTWDKDDGSSEIMIKANDSGISFFPKEKALADYNSVSLIGKVLSIDGDTVVLEMVGERNPKTDKPTIRKAKVKIGDTYTPDIVGTRIMLEGKVTSVDIGGKSKLSITADYDKIVMLS